MTKRAPNKQERLYLARVADLGCVVCRNMSNGPTPAVVHHIRAVAGMSQRAPHYLTIPLCPDHHTDGGAGVAIHADQKHFERIYGSEFELLAQTIAEVFKSE